MRLPLALASLLALGTACSGAADPKPPVVDASPADAAPPDAGPDAYTGPCRATPDCFEARPPLRCVGVWRCDPDDTHASSAPGADGCRYTCVTRLTPCGAAGGPTCPEGDACLPCPAGPQCGVPEVCVDPAYAKP
jgi:hypothetical protein